MTETFGNAVAWLVLSPIALITNIIAIIIVCHYRSKFHGTDVSFISLFVSMLLHSLLVLPIPAVLTVSDEGWVTELCSFYVCLLLCVRMSELFVTVIMNVHWMCILRCTSGQEVYSSATVVKMLVMVSWCVSVLTGLVPITGYNFYTYFDPPDTELKLITSPTTNRTTFVTTETSKGDCYFLPHGIGASFTLFFIMATLTAFTLSVIASSDTLTVFRYMRKTAVDKYKAGRFYLPSSSAAAANSASASTSNSKPVVGVGNGRQDSGEMSGASQSGFRPTSNAQGRPPPPPRTAHPQASHTGNGSVSAPVSTISRPNGATSDNHTPSTTLSRDGQAPNSTLERRGVPNTAAAVVVRPSSKSGVAKSTVPTVHARYNELNLSAELCRVVLCFTVLIGLIQHLPFVIIEFMQLIETVSNSNAQTVVLWLTLIQCLLTPHVLWLLSRRYRHALVYTWTVHILRDESAKEEDAASCTLQSYTRKVRTLDGGTVHVTARARGNVPVSSAAFQRSATGHHQVQSNGSAVVDRGESRETEPEQGTSGQNGNHARDRTHVNGRLITTDLDDGMTVITNLASKQVTYIYDPPKASGSTSSSKSPEHAQSLSPESSENSRRSSQATTSPSKSSLGTPSRGSEIRRTSSSRKMWKEQMRKKHLPAIFVNEAFDAEEGGKDLLAETGPQRLPDVAMVQTDATQKQNNTRSGVYGDGGDDRSRNGQSDPRTGNTSERGFHYYMSGDYHHDYLRSDSLPTFAHQESESEGGSFMYDDHDIEGILDREHSSRSGRSGSVSTFLGNSSNVHGRLQNSSRGSQDYGTHDPGADGARVASFTQGSRTVSEESALPKEPPSYEASRRNSQVHANTLRHSNSEAVSRASGQTSRQGSVESSSSKDSSAQRRPELAKASSSRSWSEEETSSSSHQPKNQDGERPVARKPPRRSGPGARQGSRPPVLPYQRTIHHDPDSDSEDVANSASASPNSVTRESPVVKENNNVTSTAPPPYSSKHLSKTTSNDRTVSEADHTFDFGQGDGGYVSVMQPEFHGSSFDDSDKEQETPEQQSGGFTVTETVNPEFTSVIDADDVYLRIDYVTDDATSTDRVSPKPRSPRFDKPVSEDESVDGDETFRPQSGASVMGILLDGNSDDTNQSHDSDERSETGNSKQNDRGRGQESSEDGNRTEQHSGDREGEKESSLSELSKLSGNQRLPDGFDSSDRGQEGDLGQGHSGQEQSVIIGVIPDDDQHRDNDDDNKRMITRVTSDVTPPQTAVVLDIVEETSSTGSDPSVVLEPYDGDRRPPWMDFDDDDNSGKGVKRDFGNPFLANVPESSSDSDAFGSSGDWRSSDSFGNSGEFSRSERIRFSDDFSGRKPYYNPFMTESFEQISAQYRHEPLLSESDGDTPQSSGNSLQLKGLRELNDQETERGFENALAVEPVSGVPHYLGSLVFESIEEEPEDLSDSLASSSRDGDDSIFKTQAIVSRPSSRNSIVDGVGSNPFMNNSDVDPIWGTPLSSDNKFLGPISVHAGLSGQREPMSTEGSESPSPSHNTLDPFDSTPSPIRTVGDGKEASDSSASSTTGKELTNGDIIFPVPDRRKPKISLTKPMPWPGRFGSKESSASEDQAFEPDFGGNANPKVSDWAEEAGKKKRAPPPPPPKKSKLNGETNAERSGSPKPAVNPVYF